MRRDFGLILTILLAGAAGVVSLGLLASRAEQSAAPKASPFVEATQLPVVAPSPERTDRAVGQAPTVLEAMSEATLAAYEHMLPHLGPWAVRHSIEDGVLTIRTENRTGVGETRVPLEMVDEMEIEGSPTVVSSGGGHFLVIRLNCADERPCSEHDGDISMGGLSGGQEHRSTSSAVILSGYAPVEFGSERVSEALGFECNRILRSPPHYSFFGCFRPVGGR